MKKIILIVIGVVTITCSLIFPQGLKNKKINFGSLDISPDNNVIVFTAMIVNKDYSDYSPGKWGLYFYDLQRQKMTELDTGAVYADYSPVTDVVAFGKIDNGNWDIYTYDLTNKKITRLTDSPSKDSAPTWSPDGKQIAFNSDRDGAYEVFVMSANGENAHRITNSGKYFSYNPVWSPVGKEIVYYLEKGDNMDQIYLTDANGGFNKNLTSDSSHNFFPKWLNGETIFYVGDGEIKTIKKDGTEKNSQSDLVGECICFTHDKKQILLADNKTGTISIAEYFNGKVGKKETILKLGVNNKK